MIRAILFAAVCAACATASAQAQISEVRLGLLAHDLARNIEDGEQITGQIVFDSPEAFEIIFSPRPYLYGSFNTAGNTNLGAAGLAWTGDFTDRFSAELGFGLAYHDGVNDVSQLDPGDPDRIRLANSRALLGSHILFHTIIGADYALSRNWAAGVYYEHYSHGQILASGRNQGLDEAGVRVSYRFGG